MNQMSEKRKVYLDLQCGINSTMLLGALLDAGLADTGAVESSLQPLLPGLKLELKRLNLTNGESALMPVFSPPDTAHSRSWKEVREIIGRSENKDARDFAIRVFTELTVAEARAHSVSLEEVHFHEVGNLQNILSVAGIGVVLSFPELRNARILSSPLYPGKGTVKTAHGLLPIPAPATAYLLEGLPVRESETIGEITTPTGAALIRAIKPEFQEIGAEETKGARAGRGTDGRSFSDCPAVLRAYIL